MSAYDEFIRENREQARDAWIKRLDEEFHKVSGVSAKALGIDTTCTRPDQPIELNLDTINKMVEKLNSHMIVFPPGHDEIMKEVKTKYPYFDVHVNPYAEPGMCYLLDKRKLNESLKWSQKPETETGYRYIGGNLWGPSPITKLSPFIASSIYESIYSDIYVIVSRKHRQKRINKKWGKIYGYTYKRRRVKLDDLERRFEIVDTYCGTLIYREKRVKP